SDSLLIMQTAILFTFLFAVACVVIVLAASFLSLRYQSEKEQNRLLSTVNALTEENYQKLSVLQKELSKQNHDFTNHVRTLNGLLREEDAAEALRYTEVLLKAPLERTALCKSGNTIIDAVINSKIAEAEELSIEFRFQVNFALPTNISAVDICTILGNQIDNALEACQKVQDEKDRRIDVRIYQQANSVAVFQVSNTVESDPFENNEELKTTKTDSEKLHGLGIQNIRETAEKYQGILENSYQNGKFISSALLYFTSIATEEKS
ncbi:MAG: sensor histidine kinase, partial [Acutalibacter sp.]|nr:sensor histidine kinase [Acutalibacter sp.]